MNGEDVSLEIDSIKTIDHLGIVAGTFYKLGLAPIIDRALPKIGQHQLSSSQILLALILNGLGFTERRLYLFPEYCRGCCTTQNPPQYFYAKVNQKYFTLVRPTYTRCIIR